MGMDTDVDITYTRLDEESLESTNTHFDQRLQLICIPGNYASVETDIHPALPLTRGQLLLEPSHRRRRWDCVERHVHHRRHTTARCGPRPRPEPLPLGPAWLVEVHVGIHETREQDSGGVVYIRSCAGEGRGWTDGGLDGDDLACARGEDDGGGGEEEGVIRESEDGPRRDEDGEWF